MQVNSFRIVALALLALLPASLVHAHETRTVGDGVYRVTVGLVREPAYTEERNGLDLIIRRAADNEPVEHLAGSLQAEIISPDGNHRRALAVRAQFGRPGYYTADFVLTVPGAYRVRVWGFIGGVAFDETYATHEVRPIAELRFP